MIALPVAGLAGDVASRYAGLPGGLFRSALSYEDAKEVYWYPNARSAVDGKAGAYVPLNGGKRYRPGQWSGGLNGIPVR